MAVSADLDNLLCGLDMSLKQVDIAQKNKVESVPVHQTFYLTTLGAAGSHGKKSSTEDEIGTKTSLLLNKQDSLWPPFKGVTLII